MRFAKAKACSLLVALVLGLSACENDAKPVSASHVGESGFAALEPGALALDYLAAGDYTSLRIEIDAMEEGLVPSKPALDRLVAVLEGCLEKPDGIEVVMSDEIPSGWRRERYEFDDLRALERRFRNAWSGDPERPKQAVIWVVCLPGTAAGAPEGQAALGLAVGASEVALFPEAIDRVASASVRDAAQALVLVHEVGHLLGLVNNGIPSVSAHEDRLYPRHDVSPACSMYHEIEAGRLDGALELDTVGFCPECRLDLFHAGGKPPEDHALELR